MRFKGASLIIVKEDDLKDQSLEDYFNDQLDNLTPNEPDERPPEDGQDDTFIPEGGWPWELLPIDGANRRRLQDNGTDVAVEDVNATTADGTNGTALAASAPSQQLT